MKISVIIPVYKVEKLLGPCLDSIIAQTFTDWECILVDDGSPDDSGSICDEYAEKDKRFVVIHKENAGVNKARHDGVVRSHGEWITFVDSDDYIPPRAFERMYYASKKENTIDIVMGAWEKETNGHKMIIPLMTNGIVDSTTLAKAYLFERCYRGPVGKLFRRTLFDDSVFYVSDGIIINEDLIMNLRLLRKMRLARCIPNIIVYRYIQNGNSVSHTRMLQNDWDSTFSTVKDSIEPELYPVFWYYVCNMIYRIPELKTQSNYYSSIKNLSKKDLVYANDYRAVFIHNSFKAKLCIAIKSYYYRIKKVPHAIKYKLSIIN